ncbi:hypothetical protein SDC9_99627 [bioreactor metagenome]|uniref:Uncharacterized protein n=1 Tax=bioreactor metagenome TaxID=1076179 RepID=A0A645APR3_9ZZZZ
MLGVVKVVFCEKSYFSCIFRRLFSKNIVLTDQDAGADGLIYCEIKIIRFKTDSEKSFRKRVKRGLKKARRWGVDAVIKSKSLPDDLDDGLEIPLFCGFDFKKLCALQMISQIHAQTKDAHFSAAIYDPDFAYTDYGLCRKIAKFCRMIYIISNERHKAEELIKNLTFNWGICVSYVNDCECITNSDFVFLFENPAKFFDINPRTLFFDLSADRITLPLDNMAVDFRFTGPNLKIPGDVYHAEFLGWFYRENRIFERAVIKLTGAMLQNGFCRYCSEFAAAVLKT